MVYEYILGSVVLPYTINLLSSCSVSLYAAHGKSEDRAFKNAIKDSVDSVNEKISTDLKNAITKDIQEACKNIEEANIKTIVLREFEQWGEENANPVIVTIQICSSLIEKIYSIPGLRDRVTCQQVFQIKEEIDKYQYTSEQEYQAIKKEMDQITINQSQASRCMMEILETLHKNAKDVSNSIISSKYNPLEYKDYINSKLFLENEQPDKKIACLNDVYIPNTYKPLDFPYSNDKENDDIIQFLERFLGNELMMEKKGTGYRFDTDYIYVLFIKGLPGSGKSSLFYYLANKKAYDTSFLPQYNFHFIKLISIYNALDKKLSIDNPIEDIRRYIGENNPISSDTVIVLDGLDEICVAKDLDIQAYCNNLIDCATSRKIKIIITTRFNYINISHSDNKNVINVHLINLTIKQLGKWSEKYFNVHKTLDDGRNCARKNIEYMEQHQQDLLVDIFAVPLLFYMIVATQVDISAVKSIGELYDRVFKELQVRNYDESTEDMVQKPRVSKKIPIGLARRIAIEISFKMYGTNQLLLEARSDELQEALDLAESNHYIFKEEDKKDIERLFPMTFFYKDSKDAVEFAHKSIMEFFAAEKLFISIKEYKNNFDSYVSDYIVNPIIITCEVLNFFSYFALQKENNELIKRLFPNFLRTFKEMIAEKKTFDNSNVLYPFETPIVVFKYYWYFLRNILKEDTEKINDLLDDDNIKKYITGVLSIEDSNSIPFLNNTVISYDFSHLVFNKYRFTHCHLDCCIFDCSEMNNCVFSHSDLKSTLFQNLKIHECITFNSCDMTKAVIQNWKQNNERAYASFDGCILDDATIQNMNIIAMDFQSVLSMKRLKIKRTHMSMDQYLLFMRHEIDVEKITIEMTSAEAGDIVGLPDERKEEALRQKVIAESEKQLSAASHSYLKETIKRVKFVVAPDGELRNNMKQVL